MLTFVDLESLLPILQVRVGVQLLVGIFQVGKQHIRPACEYGRTGAAVIAEHRLPEYRICLASLGALEMRENRVERLDPVLESVISEALRFFAELLPIPRCTGESDRGDAAAGHQ